MTVLREDSRGLRLAARPHNHHDGSNHVLYVTRNDEESDDSDIDAEPWPGKEAVIRPLPNPIPKKPSDRAAHRRVVEQSYRMAHIMVAAETATFLLHGRCCILGLLIIAATRAV